MRKIWLLLALAAGCSSGPLEPTLGVYETVVPGPGLPAEAVAQTANNNLDVVRHEGRVFLAFRTAPSHFAHPDTVLYVVSSTDEKTWTYETKIEIGRDIREPRFLSWQGKLHLYYAVLGEDALDFEPKGAERITRDENGVWSTDPVDVFEPGFIPWRIKIFRDRPHMIGYIGGENIYDFSEGAVDVHWMKSEDGTTWGPAEGSSTIVSTGGGSETDYASDGDDVIAVIRNELGDTTGHGSKICRNWECQHDPRKYDSPLVFSHDDHIILVGRRTLANAGRYDLGRDDLPPEDETANYLLSWSEEPKRCAVWEVDAETLAVDHLIDLPSRGDTCFASVLENDDGSYTIYNYTSPVDGEEINWLTGQLGPTLIYRINLRFD